MPSILAAKFHTLLSAQPFCLFSLLLCSLHMLEILSLIATGKYYHEHDWPVFTCYKNDTNNKLSRKLLPELIPDLQAVSFGLLRTPLERIS